MSPRIARPRTFAIGRGAASRSPVWAEHGMVCAAQPLACEAGVQVLRRGGSAADAAIAVNACLAVVEPSACGLGGDLFAMIWDPVASRLVGLNASGRSPLGLRRDAIPAEPDGTIPLRLPFSWTVPGCADGWRQLHERFGHLPIAELLAPAIALARDGFPVSPVIAEDWRRGAELVRDRPGFAEVFLPETDEEGARRAPREGEWFRNAPLAVTLERLARDGCDAFYRGAIAETLVGYSRRHGGFFSAEDFARHGSTWDEPVATSYRGLEVRELPPNGQGLAALQMLNLLEPHDLRGPGRAAADFWHRMVETKKIAYADRARYYADPAHARVPVAALASKRYARERLGVLDMRRAARTDEPGDAGALDRGDTTCLCTADATGMMVSLLQSNYTGFGSGYVVPELGFGLQNRGALFSLDPLHPNVLAPGKRPFHTIIPAFLTRDGQPLVAFGLMGGDMQAQGHAQVVVNLVDFDMSLQEAGDAIRFHHAGSSEPTGTRMRDGGVLHLEEGLSGDVLAELVRRGHVLEPALPATFGGYQAVGRDASTGMYVGATERRKDGCALGF